MTDSIIKFEVAKAIKANLKLNEIQLNKLIVKYSLDFLIPDSIRSALIQNKQESDDIKIPEHIRFDERNAIVDTTTNDRHSQKKNSERNINSVDPVPNFKLATLIIEKGLLERERYLLKEIEAIVNYYVLDRSIEKRNIKIKPSKTQQDIGKPTKLKYGELKNIVKFTIESSGFKSLNVQKGVTLKSNQIKAVYVLACNLFQETRIKKNSFITEFKRQGYSKELLNKRKSKKQ